MAKNFEIPPTGKQCYYGMMLANIIALKELGGTAHVNAINARIIKNESVSKEEQSYTMSNGVTIKLKYYLGWARTCLSLQYGGDIDSVGGKGNRGMWQLTESGYKINTLADAEKSHDRYYENLALKKKLNKSNQQLNKNKETKK